MLIFTEIVFVTEGLPPARVTVNVAGFKNITLSFKYTGLSNGISYYYVVAAVNTEGGSVPSIEVSSVPRVLFSDSLKKLLASVGSHGQHFGISAAISGDYAVCGAIGRDEGCSLGDGAAYLLCLVP